MSYPLKTVDLPRCLYRVISDQFYLRPTGEVFTGVFSPVSRSAGPRYKRWTAQVSLGGFRETRNDDLRREWEAWVAGLDGTAIAFRMHDRTRAYPKGVAAGLYSMQQDRTEYYRTSGAYRWSQTDESRRVGGAGFCLTYQDAARHASAIVLSGLLSNATVFRRGDHIGLGGNLYMVAQDAMSDSAGRSAVQLANQLWKPALQNDMVSLVRPTARFVMKDNDQGDLARGHIWADTSFEAIEVPYVE